MEYRRVFAGVIDPIEDETDFLISRQPIDSDEAECESSPATIRDDEIKILLIRRRALATCYSNSHFSNNHFGHQFILNNG